MKKGVFGGGGGGGGGGGSVVRYVGWQAFSQSE